MRSSAAESIRLNPRRALAALWIAVILQLSPCVLGQSESAAPPASSSQDAATTTTATLTTSSSSSVSSSTTVISLSSITEPTCESRTVNYITHTLPQQCLTTSPSPPPTSEPVGVTATATATGTTDSADSSGTATDDAELDEDGDDLSTGAFMSFEEWKAMMVAKSDQEALDAKPRKRQQDRRTAEGQPGGGGEYDALGEEGEIDFDAYSDKISEITAGTRPSSQQERDKEEKGDLATTYDEDLAVYRSKDAGKTCKERFSYSSFDAGATTLKTSRGTKNPTAILGESKDSYMLMECATPNKFFIVELSDVILVDTVVLANYEFFSSMIRQFRVSVSDRYPVKLDKWTVLGTFEARNARDIQAFLVENPRIWARYLRVEILNHYGNEYYCPLSLLRVHGMRMLDSLRAADPTDLEAELEDESESEEAGSSVVPEAGETKTETEENLIEDVKGANEEAQEATHVVVEPAVSIELPTVQPEQQSKWMVYWDPSYFQYTFLPNSTSPAAGSPYVSISPEEASEQGAAAAKPRPLGTPEQTSGVTISNASVVETTSGSPTESPTSDLSASDTTASSPETPTNSPTSNTTEEAVKTPTDGSSLSITSSGPVSDSATTPNNNNDTPPTSTQSASSGRTASNKNTVAPTSVVKPPPPSSSKQPVSKGSASPSSGSSSGSGSGSPPAPRNNTSSSNSSIHTSNSGSSTAVTTTSSSPPPPPPTPTVQDSFFKTLTKRLQTLESNTTLSLQYIEQQSQFLRAALARLERRQVSRVDAFLDGLNRTVLVELRDARSQCDAIWQGTVLALESQREQAERELVALGERLGVLADEVVFQKRMAIAQSALLLVCLVLVIFSSRNGGQVMAGGGLGVGAGMSAWESYYPSQFLAASPTFFPSTPKAGGEKAGQQQGDDNNHDHDNHNHNHNHNRGPIISIDSPPSSGGGNGSSSFAYGRFPDSWPRPRYRQSPSQTLLEIARRQAVPRGSGYGRGLGWGRGYGRSNSSGGVVVTGGASDDNHSNNITNSNDHNEYNDRDDNEEGDGGAYSAQQQQQRPPSSQRAVTEPPPDTYEREQGQGPGPGSGSGQPATLQSKSSNNDLNANMNMNMDMDMDVGYDSEPAMTPNRRSGGSGGDYFQTTPTVTSTATTTNNNSSGHSNDIDDGGDGTVIGGSISRVPSNGMVHENTPTPPPPPSSSYTDVLARKVAERQLTPSSSSSASDGETDYLPRSSRPPLSHAGSARTALPALPEDAD